MKKQHFKTKSWLMLAMLFCISISCNKDDAVEIGCTYSQDPDCFCQENPNNPLCNRTCDFASNPECFCEENPDDEQCCSYDYDPECFCEMNPTDILCDMGSGPSSGFYTYFDFEDQPEIDSIFETGYIPDNAAGWQENGRISGALGSGDAPQGDNYFIAEIEVLNESWTWTGNLFKDTEGLDLSSLSEPTLNFWARSSNAKPALMEIALVDDSGESGYHPGAVYMEVNGDWQQFSINIDKINSTMDWRWGDGIDVSQMKFLKFGFNIKDQALGDVFEIHVDDIYINDGVPQNAIEYPMVMEEGDFHVYFDFENQPEVDSVFATGYIPDNPNGWQENAQATGSLGSGDAPQGDYYFINEIEVINEGWTWTSNLFDDMAIDASALSAPHLNFWIRTTATEQVVIEVALRDNTGESGYHPEGPYPEIDGEWKQLSINLAKLNETMDWRWGDGIDFSTLEFLKFGFNSARQTAGDIYEVHVDLITISDGAPSSATNVYPLDDIEIVTVGPAVDLENFALPAGSFLLTDFEGDEGKAIFDSFGENMAAGVASTNVLADGDGVLGSKYASFDIEKIDGAQAYWQDFEFANVNATFDATDSVFLNLVVRYNNVEDYAMGFHPVVFGANNSGPIPWEIAEGEDKSGINKFAKFFGIPSGDESEWRVVSLNLTRINDIGWGKWEVNVTPDECCPDLTEIKHMQFALNLSLWETLTSSFFDLDAMWLNSQMPENSTRIF